MSSPSSPLVVYTLQQQHVVLPFYMGNLFGCGQLCHTQNRCALPVSDQLCLLADCFLALFDQVPNDSHHLVATDGLACDVHGGPWSTAALGHCPWGHTAEGCMLPVPSWAQASSEWLYCCLTCPVIMLPNHSVTRLLFALQQI